MNVSLKRIWYGLTTLAAVFCIAVIGYRLAGWDWIDAIYLVVLNLSTVGLEAPQPLTPALKLFTSLVIVVGVSVALYSVGGFIQMMAEGEINRALGVHRVTKEIKRLNGHTVICGFGRMGEILAREFHRQGRSFVLIDRESERIAAAIAQNYLAINGDATEEESLLAAGVNRADSLVTTLPSDANNVFISLTARNLKSALTIIARGELPSTEKKLLQAGANRVVLPAATSALRMAAMIVRPAVVELVELIVGRKHLEVEVDELILPANSLLVGSTVGKSDIRGKYGLLIMAVRRPDEQLQFAPGADLRFQAGDRILVIGHHDDVDRFRQEYDL